MSLLKAFKDYFMSSKAIGNVRPWNQNFSYALPSQQFTQIKNDNIRSEAKKTGGGVIHNVGDHNRLLEHIHLIGKGSSFERTTVKEYLKPLNDERLIRASDEPPKTFDKSKSKLNYEITKTLQKNTKNQDTIFHEMYQNLSSDIIKALSSITPKPTTYKDKSPIALCDYNFHHQTGNGNHIYTEIPKLPNFENDPKRFEQYIYVLTHSTFHYKNSSKFNGVIPKILKNLFHPLNSNTLKLRTTNSYNYFIHYFTLKSNTATVREMLLQMESEGIKPNTTTYNLLLKNVLITSNILHKSNHYHLVLKHLNKMKRERVQADVVTWNLILKLLKDQTSKVNLIQKRSELNVPLDSYLTKEMLTYLISNKKVNSDSTLGLITDLEIPLDIDSFNVLLKLFLDESQYATSYNAIKLLPDTYKFKLNVTTLNTFLVKFSKIGRLDLCLGMLNTFRYVHNVQPNSETYNMIMKCLATMGFWNVKLSIFRIMYHEMLSDCKGIVSGDYWITRLRARLNFIGNDGNRVKLSTPLTEKEKDLRKTIKSHYFQDRLIMYPSQEHKPNMRLLGFYAIKNTTSSKVDPESLETQKERLQNYKHRINALSIQKAMVKRIPYTNGNQYAALKDDLTERGIIDK